MAASPACQTFAVREDRSWGANSKCSMKAVSRSQTLFPRRTLSRKYDAGKGLATRDYHESLYTALMRACGLHEKFQYQQVAHAGACTFITTYMAIQNRTVDTKFNTLD